MSDTPEQSRRLPEGWTGRFQQAAASPIPDIDRRIRFEDSDEMLREGVVVGHRESAPCEDPGCACGGGQGTIVFVVDDSNKPHMFGDASGTTWEYID